MAKEPKYDLFMFDTHSIFPGPYWKPCPVPMQLDLDLAKFLCTLSPLRAEKEDGWMNGVLGHFYALSRLNWAGDNLG